MGLRAAVRRGARAALAASGDLAVSANYWRLASSVYDASAGAASTSYASIHDVPVLLGVFRHVGDPRFGGAGGPGPAAPQRQDLQALIAALDIPDVTPKPSDRISYLDGDVLASAVVLEIVNVETDPAEALFVLDVRRP